jgi:ubiquinone/menaquinone biosynthesis C-methylase UbiE
MPVLSEVFYELFAGQPRQGPGDSGSTAKALSLITPRPIAPRILDIGCGSGTQTLDLVRLTNGTIVAVDNYQPLLETLRQKATALGVSQRITIMNADMGNLQLPDQQFDIIWSEGAIFVIGFDKGLQEWKRLLKPGGYIAVTEAAWLKPDPPAVLFEFWNREYPAIRSIDQNLRATAEAGYSIVGHFTLPDSSWWDQYYTPLEANVRTMRSKYAGNEEALSVIEAAQLEIDLHRKYSAYYGYVFFVMRAL